jgi:hypothetical protein
MAAKGVSTQITSLTINFRLEEPLSEVISRYTSLVRNVWVSITVLNEPKSDFVIALRNKAVQRRSAVLVLCIHVATIFEEKFNGIQVASCTSPVNWSISSVPIGLYTGNGRSKSGYLVYVSTIFKKFLKAFDLVLLASCEDIVRHRTGFPCFNNITNLVIGPTIDLPITLHLALTLPLVETQQEEIKDQTINDGHGTHNAQPSPLVNVLVAIFHKDFNAIYLAIIVQVLVKAKAIFDDLAVVGCRFVLLEVRKRERSVSTILQAKSSPKNSFTINPSKEYLCTTISASVR